MKKHWGKIAIILAVGTGVYFGLRWLKKQNQTSTASTSAATTTTASK